MPTDTLATPDVTRDDAALAGLVAGGDHAAFAALMRRHNGKLFRIARATLGDDAEAEDALQDAYLDAYRHMPEFRGDAALGTWLTRIVINRSLMRMRSRRRRSTALPIERGPAAPADSEIADMADTRAESPPDAALRAEVRRLLERRIDELPVAYRTVFVMREVEEMSVQETADALSIPAATVRTRLFRARALLREGIAGDLDVATGEVFAFAGARCDRIVERVLARLAALDASPA
ncbi:MAG TPA: RNA polymerase sigma factor [Thermoanaerobaculia bacterium]|nr:RNA polymerase sigma factor [Thermoanaerobaculia bacterium]